MKVAPFGGFLASFAFVAQPGTLVSSARRDRVAGGGNATAAAERLMGLDARARLPDSVKFPQTVRLAHLLGQFRAGVVTIARLCGRGPPSRGCNVSASYVHNASDCIMRGGEP